jgi:hypothetical protein
MRSIKLAVKCLFAIAISGSTFGINAQAQDCANGDCGHSHHGAVYGGHMGHGFAWGNIPHGPLPGQRVNSLSMVNGSGDMFHNYYTQGYSNQASAEMFVAPRPVPAWVGHTYYTYQPFYPHQYMYWHKDTYHSYYDNSRGLNRTSAHYYAPPVRTATHSIINKIKIAR